MEVKQTFRCSSCSSAVPHLKGQPAPKHCSGCGAVLMGKVKPPFGGKPPERGVYRITFAPVEAEFDSDDDADSAAAHSCWGTDAEFDGFQVEKVRSTVTVETHPFVCAYSECEYQHVSETDQGRCCNCGEQQWARRSTVGTFPYVCGTEGCNGESMTGANSGLSDGTCWGCNQKNWVKREGA